MDQVDKPAHARTAKIAAGAMPRLVIAASITAPLAGNLYDRIGPR